MKTYSLDLRERVVRAVDRGEQTRQQIAERFGVGTTWIKKLLRQREETGSIAPKPHGGGMPAKYRGKALERLKKALAAQPDATLEELRDRVKVKASLMAVSRALDRLGRGEKKVAPGRGTRSAGCRAEKEGMGQADCGRRSTAIRLL